MPTIGVNATHGGTIFASVTGNTSANFSTFRGQGLAIKGQPQPSLTIQSSDATDEARCSQDGSPRFRGARSYYEIDTSSITSAVASATFDINVTTETGAGGVILIKGTDLGGTFTAFGDYLSPVGIDNSNSDASYDGVATEYSDAATLSGTGAKSITFNAAALSDMQSDDEFYVCVMSEHDYKAFQPAHVFDGETIRWDGRTGTTPPVLNYTLSTGYANNIMGVASANIGSVIGVATANIDKINGV